MFEQVPERQRSDQRRVCLSQSIVDMHLIFIHLVNPIKLFKWYNLKIGINGFIQCLNSTSWIVS